MTSPILLHIFFTTFASLPQVPNCPSAPLWKIFFQAIVGLSLFFLVCVFAIVFFFFPEHKLCRLLNGPCRPLMEVLECKRAKDCMCVCVGVYGVGEYMAWVKFRFLGLKYISAHRKGRECFCYTELYVPDQSNRISNCFTSQLVRATNCSLMWAVSGKRRVKL